MKKKKKNKKQNDETSNDDDDDGYAITTKQPASQPTDRSTMTRRQREIAEKQQNIIKIFTAFEGCHGMAWHAMQRYALPTSEPADARSW